MNSLLQNDIIRLRAVEPADAELFWKTENDSSQWILNGMSAPYSRENLLQYAIGYDADPQRSGELRFIIERTEDQIPVGIIDLYEISFIHSRAFVGIYTLPEFRNMRYASMALDLIENYAASVLNLSQLGARIATENVASVKLFGKANYQHRGTLPEWLHSASQRFDLAIFSKKIF